MHTCINRNLDFAKQATRGSAGNTIGLMTKLTIDERTRAETYRVGQNVSHNILHNLIKYWPNFEILSLSQSPGNFKCSSHYISHQKRVATLPCEIFMSEKN